MTINIVLINLLPLMLVGLIVYRAHIVKPFRILNTDNYLSIDTCKCYRGLFSVVVVYHHLAQQTESVVGFSFFTRVGYLAVAVFFFLSGYGLQKSYITKGDDYRKSYLIKRLPSILFPYLIVTILYWLLNLVSGNFYSIKNIIISIINGYPIAKYSWYIINILVFYFIYWLLMFVCKKHYLLMILLGICWSCLYVIICQKMGYGEWWYNASHLLIVGMVWATYEHQILSLLKKSYYVVTIIVLITFVILFVYNNKISGFISIPLVYINMITAAFFVLGIILLSLKLQIKSRVLIILGEISFEIYLTQGLFVTIFHTNTFNIPNDFLFCVTILASTIIFSFLLHKVNKLVLNKYFSLIKRIAANTI